MIILIGGSSHVGKTYLAQKLMEKLNIPYVSLDHLKMAFIRSKRTSLTVEDDYEMRYFLWPFAAEMVKTAIENKQSMIVEGCYIPKEWRKNFTEEYLKDIKCFFITMSEDYIRNNFDSVRDQASVIEKRIDDNPDMERLINCSKAFKEDALNNNIPLIEICSSFDIDDLIKKAMEIIEA